LNALTRLAAIAKPVHSLLLHQDALQRRADYLYGDAQKCASRERIIHLAVLCRCCGLVQFQKNLWIETKATGLVDENLRLDTPG
jgi:hypothetical protein